MKVPTLTAFSAMLLSFFSKNCFIEDEPTRWFAYPAPVEGEIEVQRS